MKRRIWLIATLAALFGLGAPFCALACLQSPAADSVVAGGAMHPCHENDPDPSPPEAPGSDSDCCEFAYDAIFFDAGTPSSITTPFATHRTASWQPVSSVLLAQAVSVATSLPPPDILLLKSTLLI